MSNSNYDLEYLIQLLYEYYYVKDKNNNRCIDTIDIDLNDIDKVENIKIVPQLNQINSYINQIFNTDIRFLHKSDQYYVFQRIGPLNTTIYLKLYQDDNSRNDLSSEDNNNKRISFLLSDLVTKKLTRHILLPIMNIDIPIKNLLPFIQKFPELSDLTKHNNSIASISIFERFFKTMSLFDYFNEQNLQNMTVDDIKNIFFQVIQTLTTIRSIYPQFNHNLLNLNTIMVYVTENGVITKISNFDIAEIKSLNSDDVKTFIESILNNDNFQKYFRNKLILEKFIIEYINMKPEQIMKNSTNSHEQPKRITAEVNGSRRLFKLRNDKKDQESSESDLSDNNTSPDYDRTLHKLKSKRSKSKKSKRSKPQRQSLAQVLGMNQNEMDMQGMNNLPNYDISQISGLQGMPQSAMPGMPNMPNMPNMSNMPNMPGMPNMSNMPQSAMPGMPNMPQPTMPQPAMPQQVMPQQVMPQPTMHQPVMSQEKPHTATVSHLQEMPGVFDLSMQNMSGMFNVNQMPGMFNVNQMQQMPSTPGMVQMIPNLQEGGYIDSDMASETFSIESLDLDLTELKETKKSNNFFF